MRCRHPELAGGALIDGCDVLALQETYVRAGELNLPGFVAYHSATSCQQASCTASPCVDPSHPAGRSRASLYVRAGLAQAEVNVCDLPCANVECVAVTVRVGATDTCVASVYVRSGRRWDTEFVCRLSDRVGGDLVVCGDFNSHHTAWGSNHIDCSGRGLLDSVLRAGLLIANTGAVTFVRSGCAGSAIDLTLVSDRCHYAWRRNPDTGGSDHFPIFLVPRATTDLPTRSYSVVNWPRFRELCAAVPVSECGLFRHIAECARAATTRCVVPAGTPVPDIKQLNLRAARRRAQRKAVRTDKREHWTVYNRLDAVCRRHARQRRSASWSSLCCSLDDPRARSRPWRILGAVLRPRVPRCPALSIAVARGITNAQLAELLAATFCPPTAASTRPTGILQPHHHPRRELMAPQRYFPAAGTLEEISALCTADFTIGELRTVLTSRRRRSAPGSDGVTYQMLRNFDSDQLHHLLDAYNAVWRSGVIPREWSEAVVVPLLKNGKPPRDPASYRPVSLTSAAGKVLEAMALRRLEWIAAVLDILAAEQSGFRRLRASADSLADVVTTLEEAKHRGDASYLVLLDVMSAFDQLPHATILDALCAMGVSGRLLAYVGAFLSGRTMRVRVGGALSQPRAVSTGVPQGSVLSPFLFNLALARIGDYIPQLPEYEVRVAVYADDIALFASGPTARGSVVRGCVQSALDAVDEYVRGIGLTLSAAKTEAMLVHPRYGAHRSAPCAPSPFPNHPDWAPNVFAFKKANREAEEKKCDRYERTLKRKRCSASNHGSAAHTGCVVAAYAAYASRDKANAEAESDGDAVASTLFWGDIEPDPTESDGDAVTSTLFLGDIEPDPTESDGDAVTSTLFLGDIEPDPTDGEDEMEPDSTDDVAFHAWQPKIFQCQRFRHVRVIIDSTEIRLERASASTAQSTTWSQYKNSNTIKVLVGLTPNGLISYISECWGGKISDKQLVLQTDFTKYLDYGDEVMADRGFNVTEELAVLGVKVMIPAYTKGKNQLSQAEVTASREISCRRIIVEQVIGRMKRFHILKNTVPYFMKDYLDDVVLLIAALTNLMPRFS
ncbi:hypothetical protein HPB49_003306 [Dermacentor silvarum]|uniref:Uncharacterized protein n=1 Tax=Dermacentor silvarum TaxID=543639 RepID=A0ACB8DAS7_DERSI|nr:hypothetical protein HPB49_003306 [Dermacentor silvarum]